MNILILLFGAVVLDLLIGDPSWIPHPVVLIGKLISKADYITQECFSFTGKRDSREYIGTCIIFKQFSFMDSKYNGVILKTYTHNIFISQ